jgi:hypothetical protein
MANIRKVLGQLSAGLQTDQDLYTVPSGSDAVVSSLVVCNRGIDPTSFRVAIRPGGEALADKHYIYYDTSISANDSFAATLGITLAEGDVVSIYANSSTLSFNIFGQENS